MSMYFPALAAVCCLALPLTTFAKSPELADEIILGQTASENAHGLQPTFSELTTNRLGETARILLPSGNPAWDGGRLAFHLAVAPDHPNYLTVRLWGSDTTANNLILFCAGRQIGYRHLGDIDQLDTGGEAAAFPGRYIYTTTPLPETLTHGRTNLAFEIRSSGPLWGYGDTFQALQKPMTTPTRGIYALYSHTNIYFVPPPGETQGAAAKTPPVRTAPGKEVLDQLKTRVNGTIHGLLRSPAPLDEMQMEFLARAYFVKWTEAYQNSNVVAQVVRGMDALYLAWRENPRLAGHDPATPNPGWFEFGPAGHAISLLGEAIKPRLNDFIQPPPGQAGRNLLRRTAWADLLVAGRDWHRHHRRLYTNQTMITDMNIYLSNRGLELLDPARALPEPAARRYLYEAVGLEPWHDSDGEPGWNVGTNYWQLTAKHLTKELGYVGYYGEVLDWVTSLYNATRPAPGQPGDEQLKAQLTKITAARAVFRYPGMDNDGYRAMRIEAVVGWRDDLLHYPGDVAYAERSTWDASTLYAAAATLDPDAVGHVQQMFADGQFFISLERQMAQSRNLRVTAGLLEVPDEYALLNAQPPSARRLPMTPGQPDFVFSDEEDGVVAVKNGDEILYASLYWRARNAVNFLARVHFTTPTMDRIAVVREAAQFEPSGEFFTRPDYITFGFGNGGPRFPEDIHSASAGEKLPIAKIPAGVHFHPGEESIYAGKADFYTLRYGHYLIAMNLTANQRFTLSTPADSLEVMDLVHHQTWKPNSVLSVPPRSTAVLWLKE